MPGTPLDNSSKLPRLPKVHGSLPKLPTLGKKVGSAAEIPALSSRATLLPNAESHDADGSGATETVAQPTKEAIARGIAELNAKRDAQAAASAGLLAGGSGPSPAAGSEDDPSAWLADGAAQASGSSDFSLDFGADSAQPGGAPEAEPAQSANLAQDALPEINDGAGASLDEPQAQAEAAAAAAVAAPQPEPQDSDGPEFGGAAAEADDFLQYEDDIVDNGGEKTVMISEFEEEGLDEENQKTQINMSAMDYDPLSGKLIVESGKTNQREYILVRDKTTIGRVNDNDIAISDISMSRHHAEISKFPEGFRLRDLDSANGSLLNGYRIRVAQLRDGDIIEFGAIRFRFEQTGGDPDELWKGEPKIEYHPNQKNKRSAPQMGSAPTVMPSRPNARQYDEPAPAPAAPAPAPQMESMLQRQGGGLNAPQWNTASPMTSPYMMGYGPNALRNINTTPTWAVAVLVALILVCFASLIFVCVRWIGDTQQANALAQREKDIKVIEKYVDDGIEAYRDMRFNDAAQSFQKAYSDGKEKDLIADKGFFDKFNQLIQKEKDYSDEIEKIRTSYRHSKSGDDLEDKIKYLRAVPEASINRKGATELETSVTNTYVKMLAREIRSATDDNAFDAARAKLAKFAEYSDSESDIKANSKLISDREKAVK